ncbi:uncharacterized protein [Diabrotica undecimpunctata]|uniref:uncharacterized protein n=1 Tax=Diabrotica undecimpunctata TaxID=50387 RepID=UPI003B634DFF
MQCIFTTSGRIHTPRTTKSEQIPSPKLILADTNCHNESWGSAKTDKHFKTLLEIINNLKLVLLNTGMPTRFNSYNGTFSIIDLSLSISILAPLLKWNSTLSHLFDSDHLPILITHIKDTNINTKPYETWKLKSADWEKYTSLITERMKDFIILEDINITMTNFNDILIDSAREAIGKLKLPQNHLYPGGISKEKLL